ncbi:MAG TPA: hypothetical protein VGB98_10375 [Pyrinomonadaceae bacterium]
MRQMTNYKLAFVLAASLVCGSLATAACSSGDPAAGAQSKDAPAQTAAASGDSIGVAECDQYLTAYESCLKDKVPAAAREMMKTSFETTRASWRQAAATPEGRAGLATACKSARDAARQAMSSYGCQF